MGPTVTQRAMSIPAQPHSPFRYDENCQTTVDSHYPYLHPCRDCPPLHEEIARLQALLEAERLARLAAEQALTDEREERKIEQEDWAVEREALHKEIEELKKTIVELEALCVTLQEELAAVRSELHQL